MKNFKKILILSFLSISLVFSSQARAQMDPRIKALAIMSAYGAAGGALLGTASIAFGADSKWIFRGASLGLYAGIAFGSYIIVSHMYQNQSYNDPYEAPATENYYPEATSPYENYNGGGQGDYGQPDYRWNPVLHMNLLSQEITSSDHIIGRKPEVPFYINVLNYSF